MSAAPAPRLKDLAMSTTEVFHLRHAQLAPGESQPREDFSDVSELADAILSAGRILLPLVVRKEKGGTGIQIQDGERRWRAVGHLIQSGQVSADFPVPCISEPSAKVHKVTDVDRLFLPLLANTGKPLNMVEKGNQYRRLIKEHGLTQAEIARRLPGQGKSACATKQAVSNAVALVEKGGTELLELVRQAKLAPTTALDIVKTHPEDHAAQSDMARRAIEAAAAANRDHATPKDLPKPLKPAKIEFHFRRSIAAGQTHELDARDFFKDPDTCVLAGMPPAWSIIELSVRVAKRPEQGAWAAGYTVNLRDAGVVDGLSPSIKGMPFASEREAWLAGWEGMIDTLGRHLRNAEGPEHSTLTAVKSLAPQFLDALDKHLSGQGEHKTPDGAGESDPAPSVPPASSTEAPPHRSTETLHFLPFLLVGRPPECSGTGDYQERYRFVLRGIPVDSPLELCHLLLSPLHDDSGVWSAGFRFKLSDWEEPVEVLPSHAIDERLFDAHIRTFDAAIDHLLDDLHGNDIPGELLDAIELAWKEVLTATESRLDDDNQPFNPDAFESIPWVAKANPAAMEEIKSAPSTNRDGSAIGLGNDGGYADPSKRMIEADKLLEELADTVHAKTISYITAETLLGYLRGERSRSDIKALLTQS